jgi:hypothetical protein
MAAGGAGIAVGVQSLVKRVHEGGWLKSVDGRRGKLRVRRMIDGRRREVLHLPASVLERSLTEKPGPIGPSMGEMTCRFSQDGRSRFGGRSSLAGFGAFRSAVQDFD